MSDEETYSAPSLEARRLSLEPRVVDPRRDRGSKHARESDSSSVDSGKVAKRADQTKSAEKSKKK